MTNSTSSGSFPIIVASLSSNAVVEPTAAGANVSTNEGVDKLTYPVTTAGLYRVSSYMRVETQSNPATTDVGVCQITYNNGTAQTAANIAPSGVSSGTVDLRTGAVGAFLAQTGVYSCAAGTNIVLTVLDTVTGAGKTVGRYDLRFMIELLV